MVLLYFFLIKYHRICSNKSVSNKIMKLKSFFFSLTSNEKGCHSIFNHIIMEFFPRSFLIYICLFLYNSKKYFSDKKYSNNNYLKIINPHKNRCRTCLVAGKFKRDRPVPEKASVFRQDKLKITV